MPDCALPKHLRGVRHNDWPWPLSRISRGYNARGPRCVGPACTCGGKGYLPWPPRLIEGHGVARWENAGASSILEIPFLADKTVKGSDVYGSTFRVMERNPGHPDFGKERFVTLTEWRPITHVPADVSMMFPNDYSPSALQKFSKQGWMKLDPTYFSAWKILKRREIPGKESGEDTVLFMRKGTRPDHLDVYYNVDAILPVGQVGLKWE